MYSPRSFPIAHFSRYNFLTFPAKKPDRRTKVRKRTDKEGEVTKFLYDGLNILKDLDEIGQEIASYVQGVGEKKAGR